MDNILGFWLRWTTTPWAWLDTTPRWGLLAPHQVGDLEYIRQKLLRGFVDPHWESMLEELVEEKNLESKVHLQHLRHGPARHRTSVTATSTWSSLPVCVLCSCSKRQNQTMRRSETELPQPDHLQRHPITYTPQCGCVYQGYPSPWTKGCSAKLWSHDLDSAYRQFPLRDQSYGYTILAPRGRTVWRHGALAFGATSIVWSFNRAADCLMFLARKLLLASVYHVDDFAAVESARLAPSSFDNLTYLCESLGLKTKPKKAAPPSSQQTLLGVQFYIQPGGVTIMPCLEWPRSSGRYNLSWSLTVCHPTKHRS